MLHMHVSIYMILCVYVCNISRLISFTPIRMTGQRGLKLRGLPLCLCYLLLSYVIHEVFIQQEIYLCVSSYPRLSYNVRYSWGDYIARDISLRLFLSPFIVRYSWVCCSNKFTSISLLVHLSYFFFMSLLGYSSVSLVLRTLFLSLQEHFYI